MPENVIKLIEAQKLTAGHAKILVGLENAVFVANKIVEKKLTVRQAENFVKMFKNKKHQSNNKDANSMYFMPKETSFVTNTPILI